ncbi:MAG: SDR family NAD(P)-dependent oxidoreductase [Acidocella sp.]|nr:SDR family NAD(P)-dependent oxidoreductase [Acidocella sp.]
MSDHCVIVTGGASGIGAATARLISAAGGYVGILDLNAEAGAAVAESCGKRAIALRADAGDENDVKAAHVILQSHLPPVTGLVNCAGAPERPRPIEDCPVDEWTRIIDSHLRTTYIACRVFGSAMATRGFGAIVNLASVLSFRPGPVLGYGPAKAAIVNLTESLAVYWARHGVRVNAVAPGWTDTPFLRPPERGHQRDLTPILRATPMGRLMRPEEIAEVINFLLSPAARIVTGTTIPCDGGVIAASGWAPYGGPPAAAEPVTAS